MMPPFLLLGMTTHQLKMRHFDVVFPSTPETCEVIVVGEPAVKQKVAIIDVEILSGEYKGKRVRASLELGGNGEESPEEIRVGDGLRIRCKLTRPKNFLTSAKGHFDYELFLQTRDIVFTSYVADGHWSHQEADLGSVSLPTRVKIRAMKLRRHLVDKLRGLGVEGQHLAVAAAMSLGDRSLIEPGTRELYSSSGASHLLALSGTHLSVIYMLITLWGGRTRLNVWKELLVVVIIWLYVLMVGMPPSAVRAALMISLCSLAYLTYRDTSSLNVLIAAFFLTILINPLAMFDVSTQLSYSAVGAIAMVSGHLNELKPRAPSVRNWIIGKFYVLTTVSLAAQIGTMPLVAYYFGQLPTYGLLTNFIAIPCATLILYLAVGALIVPAWAILIPLLSMLARMLHIVTGTLASYLSVVSSLPFSSIPTNIGHPVEIGAAYLVVISLLLVGRFLLKKWAEQRAWA